MEHRISVAETEAQKEKERSFRGLGLTSRKNLCIHPEVRESFFARRPTAGQTSPRYLRKRKGNMELNQVNKKKRLESSSSQEEIVKKKGKKRKKSPKVNRGGQLKKSTHKDRVKKKAGRDDTSGTPQ